MGEVTSRYDSFPKHIQAKINDLSKQQNTSRDVIIEAVDCMIESGKCKEGSYDLCVDALWKEIIAKTGYPSRLSPSKEYVKNNDSGISGPVPRQYGMCSFHPSIERGKVIKRDGIEWSEFPVYVVDKTKFLGSGAYGDVYVGRKENGEEAAVKMINKTKMTERGIDYRDVYKEIAIQSRLFHPNILQILDVYENKFNIAIATDVMSSDALKFANSHSVVGFTDAVLKCILRQLIGALSYLHQQNVAHRDIKPDNILVQGDTTTVSCGKLCLKLADFGFATECTKTQLLNTFPGTLMYAPPEIIAGTRYNGHKSDIWSMGVTLFVIATQRIPFDFKGDTYAYADAQKSIGYQFESRFKTLNPKLQRIISGMLAYNPDERLTADDILKSDYLQ
mgnify:CR=1 FL=1